MSSRVEYNTDLLCTTPQPDVTSGGSDACGDMDMALNSRALGAARLAAAWWGDRFVGWTCRAVRGEPFAAAGGIAEGLSGEQKDRVDCPGDGRVGVIAGDCHSACRLP